jgi:protein SCO1/2
VPPELVGVGINDRRGEQVDLDLEFTDESSSRVKLREYFGAGRPVILTLVYYECPMLCNLILNALVDGLEEVEWSAGREFEIVTVSFNPEEGPKLADVKKRAYLTQYHRPTAAQGWHFLTGEEENIRALADTVGFSYRKDEKTGEYAHPSTITFLTPDGRVSMYMDDLVFRGRDLRLALVEASQGRIGSALDQIALFVCFQYDPESNSYVPAAWKIMRSGALLTLLVVVCGLGVLWLREARGRREVAGGIAT